MKTTYTVLRADGTKETGEVDWPEQPEFGQIKAFVTPLIPSLTGVGPDGKPLPRFAWHEHVAVLWEGERRDMFVDEHFIEKRLPFNEEATKVYRNNWLTMHPDADPETLPPIHGDAVIFGRRVWF